MRKKNRKWFQISAIGISSLFLAILISAIIIAYCRPSGYTNLDPIKIQKMRIAGVKEASSRSILWLF